MEKSRALKFIAEQLSVLDSIDSARENQEFVKWRRDTQALLRELFGDDADQWENFTRIRFLPQLTYNTKRYGPDRQRDADEFERAKKKAKATLESAYTTIEKFWAETGQTLDAGNAVSKVSALCNRFHDVVRQLRQRHGNRPPLDIADEYDVQDFLHALLRLWFDDVRTEEWTPSYAGRSSRMDFLLKACDVVIETKRTRNGLDAGKLGEELIVDIARYRSHPNCKTLVCFVYDPEGRLANPRGLEDDLSREEGDLRVIVIVRPK